MAKEQYFKSRDLIPDPYLFVSRLGEKLTNDATEIAIRKIGIESGCDPTVRMSPHTFRHYFTQKQLDLGTSIYDIQRLLGHSSIQTTETYLRSISSDKVLKKGLTNSPLMNLKR
ncbi:tyrosine-type recombinase/integrase [Enterococcus pallens]|nr:site-specific integrase [Enterococcus pallens]